MNYRNHHQIMGALLPLLFFICLNVLPIGGHSQTFLDFKKAKSIEEKIRKADLIAVRYSSHSIDTLKIIGYELLVASNIHENELKINFARKYLGMYFIRCGREDDGLRLLRLSKNHFLASENFTMAAKVAN